MSCDSHPLPSTPLPSTRDLSPALRQSLRQIRHELTDGRRMLLVLTGLAIAEAYGLIAAGQIATFAQMSPDHLMSAIHAAATGLNQRYGEMLPEQWLAAMSWGVPDTISGQQRQLTQKVAPKFAQTFAQQLAQELQQHQIQAEVLGQVYESLIDPLVEGGLSGSSRSEASPQPPTRPNSRPNSAIASRRKRQGAYYTPAALVDYIVAQTLGDRLSRGTVATGTTDPHPSKPSDHGLPRLLDPACGGGIFLLVAYRHLLARQPQTQQMQLRQRQLVLQRCIAGVDIDEGAVEVTRLSLFLELLRGVTSETWTANRWAIAPILNRAIRQGNALVRDNRVGDDGVGDDGVGDDGLGEENFRWQKAFPEAMAEAGFDGVIGNPPYLDSEAMTTCLPHWRHYCNRYYQSTRGNWDLFCVFIEQALHLCKPGGVHSFVVPNKLLSAAYAAGARSLLMQQGRLRVIRDYSQSRLFDAAVYPVVYVVERRSPSGHDRALYAPNPLGAGEKVRYERVAADLSLQVCYTQELRPAPGQATSRWQMTSDALGSDLCQTIGDRFPPLAALAQVSGAATVAEAYRLKPLIQSATALEWPAGDYFQVVNSGTIDRYCHFWATKPLRYLSDRIPQPVIGKASLQGLLPQRYQQAKGAKLIVASMTRQLECVADLDGDILAAKSTSIIGAARVPLLYLLGILNSRLMSLLFCQHTQGNSLKGGYLPVGPPQLRPLPIPNLTTPQQQHLGDRLVRLVETRQRRLSSSQAPSESKPPSRDALDQAIDQVVYQLYQLEADDIERIEQGLDK